jgi:hypothetical protein
MIKHPDPCVNEALNAYLAKARQKMSLGFAL